MVEIYTKTGCPFCAAAKEDFKKRREDFVEIDVNKNPGKAEKIFNEVNRRVVPIIVRDNQVQIGFNGY